MANREYDSDIIGWFTRGGKRVPVRNSQKTRVEVPPKYQYNNLYKKVLELYSGSFDEGTYDVDSLAPVDYPDGFQVTFCQIGADYTEAQYNELIAEFLSHTDDMKVSLGKWGEDPEFSFHFKSRAEAIKFGKKYNQQAVWDWEAFHKNPDNPELASIDTGGTGRREK